MDQHAVVEATAVATNAPAEQEAAAAPVVKAKVSKAKLTEAEQLKAIKKELAEAKAVCSSMNTRMTELEEELEGQRRKNEIVHSQNKEMKVAVNEMEQKQAMAVNQITQKLQMLGNDVIIMLNK